MMKFNIKNTKFGYLLYDKFDENLITFGDILLKKENKQSFSYCVQREDKYNYKGIEDALCGRIKYLKNYKWKGEYFIPLRIVVVQMI